MASTLVRHWRKARRPHRWWPRRVLFGVAAAAAVALASGIWLGSRPHPWRPPGRAVHFVSCTYGGYVAAWCANVAVPYDPRRPGGRTIELHVAVLPSTTHPSAGALFYLEGGPGGAATASAIPVNAHFAVISRTRDIVMVDQRGAGGPAPPTCPGAARVPALDAAAVAAYVRRCFARIGRATQLDTTSVSAADLEAVRRALGYGKVDVYGSSYGATLAQAYVRLDPASVRSVVLDSGSLPNVRIFDVAARNAQRALDAVFASCARTTACRRAYPSPQHELAVLLRRPPRRVEVQTGTYTFTPDDVAWTVEALSTSPDGAATIPYEVDEAVHGNYVPLGQAYAALIGPTLDPPSQLAMYWTILCSEPWASMTPAATARVGYLGAAAVARAEIFSRACRAVPRGRVPPGAGAVVPTRVPTLLLTGGADPLDPVANLEGWQRAFPNGRLVVVPGGGHASIGDPCVQSVVARFIAAGSARGLDTSCVVHIAPPPFETP